MTEPILLETGSSGPTGWSSSSTVLRCGRKRQLQRAGYVEGDRDALIKGSLCHTGVAHYYARLQAVQQGWDPERYYPPTQAISVSAQRNGEAWIQHEHIAQKAVTEYQRVFAAVPEQVVAVEHLVRFPFPKVTGPGRGPVAQAIAAALPDELHHTMRVDLILMTPDQRFLLVDHKTTSTPGAKGASTDPFDLSGQILALRWWGRQVYGNRFAGVEIGKLNLTTGRIERQTPKVAPHAVAEWPKTRTWIAILELMGNELYGADNLAWPMAMSDQGPCLDRYGPCGFRESCRLGLPGGD